MENLFAVGNIKKVREIGQFVDVESRHILNYTLLEAESMLFLSMIFHLLFPENSPQPVRVKKLNSITYTIAFEKIDHDPLHAEVNKERLKIDAIREHDFSLGKEWEENESKLNAFEDDPKYQATVDKIWKSGFGKFYSLRPANFIRDEKSGEYIFVDFDPAIRQRHRPYTPGRYKTVPELSIPFEEVEEIIEKNLTGVSYEMALGYLGKLRELLPKIHRKAYKNRQREKAAA